MIRTAAELCAYHEIPLRPEGTALLTEGLSPRQFFDRLVENGCQPDARRVLAHAMGRRQALWWGCLCAWETYRADPPPLEQPLLEAVGRLVVAPDEARRRELEACLAGALPTTPAGLLAVAALFGGGSVSTPGLPFVAPRPFVTGRLVSVSVYLASVYRDPCAYPERLRRFLTLGLDIALGRRLWQEDSAAAPLCQSWNTVLAGLEPAHVGAAAGADFAEETVEGAACGEV